MEQYPEGYLEKNSEKQDEGHGERQPEGCLDGVSQVRPRTRQDKLISAEQLVKWRQAPEIRQARVVFTNGCFDILHIGHIELLEEARNLGDFLVVGVNSDSSVRRLKGDGRPVFDAQARAGVLAAITYVDFICVFDRDTPIELIQQLQPDVHVKGGDYLAEQLPEASAVREGGGTIHIVPLRIGYSSTKAITQYGL